MGHPDGAHTHGGHGGSGAGSAGLVVLAVVLVVSIAGPVIAAITSLIEVLSIAAAITAGVTVAGLAGFIAWRLRHDRIRTVPRESLWVTRPGVIPPPPQRPAIERPGSVHLHLHGVDAGELAAILHRAGLGQPGNDHPAVRED